MSLRALSYPLTLLQYWQLFAHIWKSASSAEPFRITVATLSLRAPQLHRLGISESSILLLFSDTRALSAFKYRSRSIFAFAWSFYARIFLFTDSASPYSHHFYSISFNSQLIATILAPSILSVLDPPLMFYKLTFSSSSSSLPSELRSLAVTGIGFVLSKILKSRPALNLWSILKSCTSESAYSPSSCFCLRPTLQREG